MTRDQSDYDFLVSEYGKTQNRIRDLEEENTMLREKLVQEAIAHGRTVARLSKELEKNQ